MTQSIKRVILLLISLFFILTLVSDAASAINDKTIIDLSQVNNGYFIINYEETQNLMKMKVGVITPDNKTLYYDYHANQVLSYPLINGNGYYTISLYKNIRNTKYQRIETKSIYVNLNNKLSPFLVSTYDARFSKGDLVDVTANSICKNIFTNKAKVQNIYNFINKNIKYDYKLANQITNKIITSYIPSPIATLKTNKGICYDIASLFASMCKTQNIPCYIVKGEYKGVPHAWNNVYINNTWYKIDPNQKVFQLLPIK